MGKLNEGNFACLAEGLVTKMIISSGLLMTGTCNYYVTANNPIYSTMYAMAFPVSTVGVGCAFATQVTTLLGQCTLQKNVQFQEEVNVYLRRLDEAGLIRWWISEFLVNADNCDTTSEIIESHKREIVSLRLKETSTFFVILATGHALASMVFLVEFLSKKSKGKSGCETEIYMGHPL